MPRNKSREEWMKGVGFYRYIVKNESSYSIKKGNERFGTYNKLSDALYERDQLIKADWDWSRLSELPETTNFYKKMRLPPFTHESSYIYETTLAYKVFLNGEYYGQFNTKKVAYEYAGEIGGKVVPVHKRFLVQKRINGRSQHFGTYKTFEEAKKRRDELIKCGWKE